MTERLPVDMIFIQRLTEIIHSNLNNENFGVKELANESGLNQKVLRRKIRAFNKTTINQFIREVRLQKALKILQNEEITASEVAYKVGFGSPAYFNTCFNKYFGYPPGKVKKSAPGVQDLNIMTQKDAENGTRKSALRNYLLSLPGILLIAVLLGTIGYLFYKNISKSESTKSLISTDGRISIAVMPFQNRTNDTIWNIWQEGIQNEIITFLTNYKELKLKQSESISGLLKNRGITTYASLTPSLASLISKKLDANVFLYGNIIIAGSTLLVNAQLIDTKTKEVYKSFQMVRTAKEDFIFQIIDSLSLQIKNFLLISILEKKLLPEERRITSTTSPEAYRYYINGLKAFLKSDFHTAVGFYSHALAIDSNFTMAASDMSYAYAYLGKLDQTRKWSLWLYEKRDKMPIFQKIFVEYTYANNFGTPYESLKYLKQLQEYDEGVSFHFLLGNKYLELGQFSEAIIEFEKNLETLTRMDPKSAIDWDYSGLGLAYHKAGQYKKEKKLYKKAAKYFPESFDLIYRQAVLSLTEGDTAASNRYIEEYRSIQKNNAVSEADIVTTLAEMYSEADFQYKAEDYYRSAFSLEPDNPIRIRNLSYFLVDKERGIDEGLALADTDLKLKPDDFEFLHIKGWGLYKQGKNEQALELLQKSWDIRNQYSVYDHTAYLHLEEVKKSNTNTK